MDTYCPLIFSHINDGIPFEKIEKHLEAGILFTVRVPGSYVLILDEGKVYLRDLNHDE